MIALTFMINIMRRSFFGHDGRNTFESMPFCVFFSQRHTMCNIDDSMILNYRPLTGRHRIPDSGYRRQNVLNVVPRSCCFAQIF
ncbi:aldo/keto reductase [Salmonella enterica subsp. enterica serovar Newport]|nr:aldo/keto reductase [Salmonella enterica subsp. enterica serovar Newport]